MEWVPFASLDRRGSLETNNNIKMDTDNLFMSPRINTPLQSENIGSEATSSAVWRDKKEFLASKSKSELDSTFLTANQTDLKFIPINWDVNIHHYQTKSPIPTHQHTHRQTPIPISTPHHLTLHQKRNPRLNHYMRLGLRTLFNTLDDIGILLLLSPMSFLQNIEFLNLLDDMGIILIIRPLGYLHCFAEIILLADE
ncbi:hypothetical protein DL98DRAFT_592392 [Cadophora sp. DSE1049]|nr:hypothetical protein DL98DRAFT_592392 [Cadophora sp. DSE1049]